MDDTLKTALAALLSDLLGPTGPGGDAAIMAAQADRAAGLLVRPPMAPGSLFELEPSSHAALLRALADRSAA